MRNFRNTEYEPEVFPGLMFRMEDLDVTLLIFVEGKGVGAGFKKEENIERELRNWSRLWKRKLSESLLFTKLFDQI